VLGKLIAGGFIILVFLGLGVSGTVNALITGYHNVESNSVVKQLQNHATNAIKNEATTQFNAITHTAANVIDAKIGGGI
jgi:hypothetical protein